ncbi:MAG: putative colanic acid biosynthesis acetyltransferase [Prochlorococcaceae cyanobacterium]
MASPGASPILQKETPFQGASFSLGNRVARVIWQWVWLLLCRPTPAPLHGWRCLVLKAFGARLGRHCHVYPDVRIWAPWNLELDDEACLGRRVICYSMDTISLGKRVVVSQGVHLCTGSHDYESPNFQLFTRPIKIEADVWICTEAFLGPGVTIGEGAVIGARSVVTRSQPAWMVCAGNPCKPIKLRKLLS